MRNKKGRKYVLLDKGELAILVNALDYYSRYANSIHKTEIKGSEKLIDYLRRMRDNF